MRIEKSTYTPESTGKPVPRVDVFMRTNEVADTMMKFCENPISGSNYYLDLKAGFSNSWATGERPHLTYAEAIAELKAMRSQYWEDKRKHALLQADLDIGATATEYTLSETGLFFDVARVIEGQPECWIQETEAEQRRMVLQINYFVHHEVTADQLFTAIEGVINTYKTLIKSGFQVKVEVCFSALLTIKKSKVGAVVYHIAACDWNEFLDEATLTYLVSPTFCRMFKIPADNHFFINQNGGILSEMAKFIFESPVQYKTGQIDFWGVVSGPKVKANNLHHYKLENIQKVIEAGPQPG